MFGVQSNTSMLKIVDSKVSDPTITETLKEADIIAAEVSTFKLPFESILTALEVPSIVYELWSMVQSVESEMANASMIGKTPSY